jgi:nitrite reductase (NADH) large subunit
MSKKKLVMVGNGMAGVRTLEELLKIAPDHYDITVFRCRAAPELQPHPAFAGARRRDDDPGHHSQRSQLVREHGITLHLGKKSNDRPRASAG